MPALTKLASHFSRKVEADWSDADREGVINFQAHNGIEGASDAVERFERVVGSHLVRFGARDGLVVRWKRDDGPGQTFTASDPDPPSR